MGFEPTTTCLGSSLGSSTMRHAATQQTTTGQQYHAVPSTARYRPQQRDTGATVKKPEWRDGTVTGTGTGFAGSRPLKQGKYSGRKKKINAPLQQARPGAFGGWRVASWSLVAYGLTYAWLDNLRRGGVDRRGGGPSDLKSPHGTDPPPPPQEGERGRTAKLGPSLGPVKRSGGMVEAAMELR
jgi:hypothetical protein